jgi:tryptophan synthase alpha chain
VEIDDGLDVTGIERIAAAFATSGKRAALMPYLMGGYPDLEASAAVGEAYADAGADLVELGVPFSDPLADGPVIHAAGTEALRRGATVDGVLELARRLSARLPVVVMCYANPILARGGGEGFVAELADVGASGLIVPDLPFEEAPSLLEHCDRAGIALVPLVAPTTTADRLAAIASRARGFLYVVSLTGTTGERDALGAELGAMLERARAASPVPVAVGFGIATPEQAAAAVDAGAQGVIVGSRLVRAAGAAADPAAAVAEIVSAMAAALR